MAYEADRVVVELIAKTDQLDKPIVQSANTYDASMNKIVGAAGKAEAAHTRLAKSAGNTRLAMMEFGHVGRAVGDQLAAGTPFVQIFTQHIGQVGQAVSLSGAGAGKFAAFLGGPWGIAVTLATVVIAKFALGHKDAASALDEAINKLEEEAAKAENTRKAMEIFKGTLEGVTKALNDNEDALKALGTEQDSAAHKALVAAIAAKMRLENIRNETLALIDQAKAQIELNNALATGPETKSAHGDPRLIAADQARGRLEALQKKVESANTQIQRSQAQILEASSRVAVEVGQRLADPAEVIKKKYADLIESARQRLKGEKDATREIARQTLLLTRQRDAELELLRARKQGAGEHGKQIGFADAAAIARGAGLTVTSSYRQQFGHGTPGHMTQEDLYNDPAYNRPGDPVARPGTSAHGGVNGKWALDIAFAPGLSAQSLKKLYGDQGVSLTAVYKEKGHFHIEGSRSEAAGQEREAARLAAEEQRRLQAFVNEKAGLEDQVLDARQALVMSAADVADIEAQAVEASRQKYAQNVKALQEQGKLNADEAQQLIALNDERAKLRLELVKRREAERTFREAEARNQQALAVQSGGFEAQAEVLQGQERLARTSKERREIEQRLLDLQFAEEKMRLQYQIAYAARLQTQAGISESEKAEAEAQAAIARMKLQTIDQRHGQATESNNRSNASPLQSYLQSIPQTAAEIDDALEQVAANGLESFTNGIVDAIVNFKSLGDVARTILAGLAADLIKLAIQQVILHTIGASLGAASVATTTAAAAAAGAAWAGPAALASLATLGANAGPAAAALASTTALATVLGAPKARGGRIRGSGSDTSDNILTPMSPGEFAINAQSARNIGYDALEYMNEHGRLPMGGGGFSPVNAHAARGGGRGGFSPEDIRTLSGIVSEAARAMPDVSLYASLDPADMLQRALGAPAGHRAMLAYLNNNTSAVKASLNRP